jgi:hypothetical protein
MNNNNNNNQLISQSFQDDIHYIIYIGLIVTYSIRQIIQVNYNTLFCFLLLIAFLYGLIILKPNPIQLTNSPNQIMEYSFLIIFLMIASYYITHNYLDFWKLDHFSNDTNERKNESKETSIPTNTDVSVPPPLITNNNNNNMNNESQSGLNELENLNQLLTNASSSVDEELDEGDEMYESVNKVRNDLYNQQNALKDIAALLSPNQESFIDIKKTLDHGLQSLDPKQLENMTSDTKKLIETQSDLLKTVKQLVPIIQNGKEMVEQFKSMFGELKTK